MNEELRASDAERERAVVRLREASAEGRLTLEELATRTGDAYLARTHGELVKVTADLPETATAAAPAVPEPRERPGFVVGFFAPVRRRGRWHLKRKTIVLSVFAPVFLDLRPSRFEHESATISIFSLFAPVQVTVPEHVDVDVSVVAIFAPVQERGSPGELAPAAPRVRVNGLSIFAPVFVRVERS
jgi:DUF1707 SHOCT-like domain